MKKHEIIKLKQVQGWGRRLFCGSGPLLSIHLLAIVSRWWNIVACVDEVDHINAERNLMAKIQHPFAVNMSRRSAHFQR